LFKNSYLIDTKPYHRPLLVRSNIAQRVVGACGIDDNEGIVRLTVDLPGWRVKVNATTRHRVDHEP
jgi:hypothetical protein